MKLEIEVNVADDAADKVDLQEHLPAGRWQCCSFPGTATRRSPTAGSGF
jgi:hypothetical protein